MEKVIRDGKIAVIISSAGWYTDNSYKKESSEENKKLLFHPKLVEIIETNRQEEIDEEWVLENLGLEDIFISARSLENLKIVWINEGTKFTVMCDNDGTEFILTENDLEFTA